VLAALVVIATAGVATSSSALAALGAIAAAGVAAPSCTPAALGAEVVAGVAEVFLVVERLDERLIMV
jgi:hypothetical protein